MRTARHWRACSASRSWLFLLTRTLRKGDPFAPGNPRRLYGIALLVLLGGVLGNWPEAITGTLLVTGTPLGAGS
ncbi:hypothetical protein [Spirillospora sp. NBC_01491]|uniref:hypothetical protein n=1 Tax=Spirillospora sp. NBC_01491 TaxID=2976007 RepID=UPI002E31AA40|nr:hypothetical protein [Spirillospora sp. NBC_01491]